MLCVVNEILNYLILNYGLHCDNFFYYCPAVFYKARHLSLSIRYTELKMSKHRQYTETCLKARI